MEFRRVGAAIVLSAESSADIVYGAIALIGIIQSFVNFTRNHGIRTGKGVVMAGEHGINTYLVTNRSQDFYIKILLGCYICVIYGSVGCYELPVGAACCGVLFQPFGNLCQLCLVSSIVYYCNVDTAVVDGVVTPVVGIIDILTDIDAGILVVTHDVDNIGATECAGVEVLEVGVPIRESVCAFNCVTHMNAEGVVISEIPDLLVCGLHSYVSVFTITAKLGVSDDEEVGGILTGFFGGKLADCGPVQTVANLVNIGGTGGKAGYNNAIGVCNFLIAIKVCCLYRTFGGYKRCFSLGFICRLGGIEHYCLVLSEQRIGKPGNILAGGSVHGRVKLDCMRQGIIIYSRIAHCLDRK